MGLFLFVETPAQTDGNYQSKSRVTGLQLRQFASPWMLIHRDLSSAGGARREGRIPCALPEPALPGL